MITAIVLAAGKSIRMGKSKMILNWGESTVIGKVVSTIIEAGILDLIVVTGKYQKEVIEALETYPVKFLYNPEFEHGEMISSVKIGLSSLGEDCEAALIVLGDQPQIEPVIVRQVIDLYLQRKAKIVVPSYKKHRGHPWLLDKTLWHEVLELDPEFTLKDYLSLKQQEIAYVEVDSPSILLDLDTPHDYQTYQP